MDYIIKINALGTFPEIKIDADRFEKIKEARVILTNALAIEEKYEILLQNYLEFKKGLLAIAAEAMIRTVIDYEALFRTRVTLDRLIVNFLTTAKLYIDQLQRHVCKSVPQDKDAKSTVEEWFHTQYDSSIEYRFMEALRNVVQHRDLAVHLMGTGGKWTSHDGSGMLERMVNLSTEKLSLEKDAVFKKTVLKEIGEEVDLKIFTRGYMACLSNIHGQARAMIQGSVDSVSPPA